MKIYHHPMSSSARRAIATATHLGITFESRLTDLMSPADRAELVALNPNSKIPVLVEGDLVLWESHAIMRYLCARMPDQTLYPAELRARTEVDRWLDWSLAHLGPAVGPISFEKMWKKLVTGLDPDPAVIERHSKLVHQFAQVLDRHLAARTWLVGRTPTLADFSVAAVLMYRTKTELPLDAYQHLLAYLGRVSALPAWQATEPTRAA